MIFFFPLCFLRNFFPIITTALPAEPFPDIQHLLPQPAVLLSSRHVKPLPFSCTFHKKKSFSHYPLNFHKEIFPLSSSSPFVAQHFPPKRVPSALPLSLGLLWAIPNPAHHLLNSYSCKGSLQITWCFWSGNYQRCSDQTCDEATPVSGRFCSSLKLPKPPIQASLLEFQSFYQGCDSVTCCFFLLPAHLSSGTCWWNTAAFCSLVKLKLQVSMEAKYQLLPAPPNKARQPFHLCPTKKYHNAIKRGSLPEAQTVSSRRFKAGVKLGFELLTFEQLFSSHLAQGKEKSSLLMSVSFCILTPGCGLIFVMEITG